MYIMTQKIIHCHIRYTPRARVEIPVILLFIFFHLRLDCFVNLALWPNDTNSQEDDI